MVAVLEPTVSSVVGPGEVKKKKVCVGALLATLGLLREESDVNDVEEGALSR